MIERIGTAAAAQPKVVQSAKASEDAKAREISEKEQPTVQTNNVRKRDRFERSSEVSDEVLTYSPQTRKASDESLKAAQENSLKSFDRLELSGGYLSKASEKTADVVKASDMSETRATVKTDDNGSEETASQSVSADSSSEEVDTNKLYQYTDTELKDFLIDGSITQSEYDAEIAKRELC